MLLQPPAVRIRRSILFFGVPVIKKRFELMTAVVANGRAAPVQLCPFMLLLFYSSSDQQRINVTLA